MNPDPSLPKATTCSYIMLLLFSYLCIHFLSLPLHLVTRLTVMTPGTKLARAAWTFQVLRAVLLYLLLLLISLLLHRFRRVALTGRNGLGITDLGQLPPEGDPDYVYECKKLTVSLLAKPEAIRDIKTADGIVSLARKVLALSQNNDDERRAACMILSYALGLRFMLNLDHQSLDESMKLEREAQTLCPPGHPLRATSCENLARILMTYQVLKIDDDLLKEAIALRREALALHPEGHPERIVRCSGLADSLSAHHERTGDDISLQEAIGLRREALALCPVAHLNRAAACRALAELLWMRHESSSEHHLLDEAIGLQREALALRRAGGFDWVIFGNDLSKSLWTHHQVSGDDHFLDQAIDLQREIDLLRPKGHPYRASYCCSLGILLRTRYERTGDRLVLDEAIDLQREALALCPARHSERASFCENLAASLLLWYQPTRDNHFLLEAIRLQREAIALHPAGHPTRFHNCGDLAELLWTHHNITGDKRMLAEAIDLQREALALCPAGHRDRSIFCGRLAALLIEHCQSTHDDSLLDEIFDLLNQAIAVGSARIVWMFFPHISWVHLRRTSAVFYDVRKAILCLSRCLESDPDEIPRLLPNLVISVNHIWNHDVEHHHNELTVVYQRLVNFLPLLANTALGTQSQLRALRWYRNVGPDAFVSAALAGNHILGIETLEVAQGVIWSQSLHHRDPQLQGIPEPLSSELEGLLNAIASQSWSTDPRLYDGRETFLTARDIMHVHSSRAYSTIQKIRAMSGFERFMLGETYETLSTTASAHPVVVLVGARGYFYAFIIAPSQPHGNALISLELTDEDMGNMSLTSGPTRAQRGAPTPNDACLEVERGMKKTVSARPEVLLHRQLRALWLKVVKPVLDSLDMKASQRNIGKV
jgi:tetratricopeptide (TPR) repeat protein